MRFIFISLVSLLLSPALLVAQEARQVSCRTLGFGSDGKPDSIVIVSSQGNETSLTLAEKSLSKKVSCPVVNNRIAFLTSGDKKPFAIATIPEKLKSAILVFVKSPEGAGEAHWNVVVIDDSKKNFPEGGAYVANFYNKEVRFIIGEHKGMLKAGGSNGYAMPKNRNDFNMAPVVFELLSGDKWRIASESSLRFLPQLRYLMFAYVDPISGRPRVSTVRDMEPIAEPNPISP